MDLDACVEVPDREISDLHIRRTHRHQQTTAPRSKACTVENSLIQSRTNDGRIMDQNERIVRLPARSAVGSRCKVNRVIPVTFQVDPPHRLVERSYRVRLITQIRVTRTHPSNIKLGELRLVRGIVGIGPCLGFSLVRPTVVVIVPKGFQSYPWHVDNIFADRVPKSKAHTRRPAEIAPVVIGGVHRTPRQAFVSIDSVASILADDALIYGVAAPEHSHTAVPLLRRIVACDNGVQNSVLRTFKDQDPIAAILRDFRTLDQVSVGRLATPIDKDPVSGVAGNCAVQDSIV